MVNVQSYRHVNWQFLSIDEQSDVFVGGSGWEVDFEMLEDLRVVESWIVEVIKGEG